MLPDSAFMPSQAHRTVWDASPVLVVPMRVRVLGSALGFVVGAAVTVATLAVELASASFPLSPVLAGPVLFTGAISGWFMAPAGWAIRPGGKLGVVIRMALLAVAVGDAVLAVTIVGGPGGGESGVLAIMLIGLVLFGWIALPFTGVAAVMWVAAMSYARRRVLED